MSSFWTWVALAEEIKRMRWMMTKKMTKEQRRWNRMRINEEICKYCRAVDGK